MTDAYGGHGGISRFNRDFLAALSEWSGIEEAVVFPRLVTQEIKEAIPPNIRFVDKGVTGKFSYIVNVLRHMLTDRRFDLLICGHINLIPMAWLLSRWIGCPLLLIIHGIDAWEPTRNRLANRLCRSVDGVVAVSKLTLDRFCGWSKVNPEKGFILPNTVDLSAFTPGPKNPQLLARYGLTGKTVILTLGRIPSSERYKGYDEIIELMPSLLKEIPNLTYLIAGDGNDRSRLEEKARALGVTEQVIFAGMIAEEEKVDHYRLADAYVMPSRGEGFGIVLLEAMSCGLPVMASKLDGGREALRDGLLGILVDPREPQEILTGIKATLSRPKHIPEGVDYFSHANFRKRVHDLVSSLTTK